MPGSMISGPIRVARYMGESSKARRGECRRAGRRQ